MRTDLYTKIILTTIAALLGILALRPLAAPLAVRAEGRVPYMFLQFDEKLRQIDSPRGGSMIGRVAIDLRTGNIYGFPTNAVGYPRNPGKSEIPVSDPILLGRFNLDGL